MFYLLDRFTNITPCTDVRWAIWNAVKHDTGCRWLTYGPYGDMNWNWKILVFYNQSRVYEARTTSVVILCLRYCRDQIFPASLVIIKNQKVFGDLWHVWPGSNQIQQVFFNTYFNLQYRFECSNFPKHVYQWKLKEINHPVKCLITKLHTHLYNISCHVITVLGASWKYNYITAHSSSCLECGNYVEML